MWKQVTESRGPTSLGKVLTSSGPRDPMSEELSDTSSFSVPRCPLKWDNGDIVVISRDVLRLKLFFIPNTFPSI